MVFRRIDLPNSELTQLYAYDSLSGIQAIIKPCADNSGLIGRVSDAHTGDTLREFFGSSETMVKMKIDEFVKSLITMGFVGSL